VYGDDPLYSDGVGGLALDGGDRANDPLYSDSLTG
jgi:hypothetical protein